MELKDVLPAPQDALALQPEQLGLLLLRYLASLPENAGYLNRHNFTNPGEHIYAYAGRALVTQVSCAFAEAWAWLEREGLVIDKPGDTSQWVFVTRRGRALADSGSDLDSYRKGFLLPSEGLDPVLKDKARALFLAGDYDTAVFRAFKEVEVRVRKAAELPDSVIGVDLMRKAFGPGTPLCDVGMLPAEAKSVADLFAGAVGLFKNPSSHREALSDPAAAADAIALANLLLRLIGSRRESDRNQSPSASLSGVASGTRS